MRAVQKTAENSVIPLASSVRHGHETLKRPTL